MSKIIIKSVEKAQQIKNCLSYPVEVASSFGAIKPLKVNNSEEFINNVKIMLDRSPIKEVQVET